MLALRAVRIAPGGPFLSFSPSVEAMGVLFLLLLPLAHAILLVRMPSKENHLLFRGAMRMKKRIWIAILTAVLLLNLLPGMTAYAVADDGQSRKTLRHECPECMTVQVLEIIGYV